MVYIIDFEKIKIHILKKGTAKKMCDFVGITEATWINNFNARTVKMETFLSICDYLGESPGLFFKKEDSNNTEPEPIKPGKLVQEMVTLMAKPRRTPADEKRLDEISKLLDSNF